MRGIVEGARVDSTVDSTVDSVKGVPRSEKWGPPVAGRGAAWALVGSWERAQRWGMLGWGPAR